MMFFMALFEYHKVYQVKIRSSLATGSGVFVFLGCDFVQIFGQIVSIRVMTLINTNVVASSFQLTCGPDYNQLITS